jgi:hypothetical protein
LRGWEHRPDKVTDVLKAKVHAEGTKVEEGGFDFIDVDGIGARGNVLLDSDVQGGEEAFVEATVFGG